MKHLIKSGLITLLIGFAISAFAPSAFAVGSGKISAGQGKIESTPQQTDIRQESQVLITDWNNFDIGANERVQAHQPNSYAKLLIRVESNRGTNIAGEFSANGVVILQNQAGIEFSGGSVVNVGGLIATSGQVQTDSLTGYDGIIYSIVDSKGSVINRGTINADGSGVMLLGAQVENHGAINANQSNVRLAAGRDFNIYDDGVALSVERPVSNARLVNTGDILAYKGNIEIEAREAEDVNTEVASISGNLAAVGGAIYISGGRGILSIAGNVIAEEIIYIASNDYIVVKSTANIYSPQVHVGARNFGGLINYSNKRLQPIAKRILVESDANIRTVPGGYGYLNIWASEKVWVYGFLASDNIVISARGELDHESHGRRFVNQKNGIGYIDLRKVSAGTSLALHFDNLVFSDEQTPAPVLTDGVLSDHNIDTYYIDVDSLHSMGAAFYDEFGDKELANRVSSYVLFWTNNLSVNSEIDVSGIYNLYLLAQGDVHIASGINTNKGNLIISAIGNVDFGSVDENELKKASVNKKEPIDVFGNRVVIYSGSDEQPEDPSNRDINIVAQVELTLGTSIDAGKGNLRLAVVNGGINILEGRKTVLRGNKVSISYTKASSGEYVADDEEKRVYPLISENPNVVVEGANGVEINEPEVASPEPVSKVDKEEKEIPKRLDRSDKISSVKPEKESQKRKL